ncbi:hypothetical protein ACRCUN_18860 [Mycobacterium sp. LTG2003]
MKAVTAQMQWVCEDPRRLEGPRALARLAPAVVNSYKLNLFRLGG